MRARLTAPVAALAAVLLAAPSAAADPVTDFESPFPCAQSWFGSTRDSHSPSPYAIDWNREDDVDDPVVASAAGTVTTADRIADSGYGRWVVIDHGNGEKSLYAHMNTVTVTVGQYVDQGAQIGTVGSTGNSTGPHLHYEQRNVSSVVAPFFHQVRYAFGTWLASKNCVDVPLAADWNGDGIGQLTVFRRGNPASFLIHRPGLEPKVKAYGAGTDEPVLGDWDGNGAANPGVRTPSTRTFKLRTRAGETTFVFGTVADKPVAGNWDGVGPWEVGVWRASRAKFLLRAANGTVSKVALGGGDDLPVTGDWDANGRTDLGVWTPSTGVFKQRFAPSPTGTMRRMETVAFGRPRG